MLSTELTVHSPLPSSGTPRLRIKTDYVNSFIFWSTVIYISTLVFEGPLRFYLSSYGMGSLLYFRDLLALTCVALGIIKALFTQKNVYDPLLVTIYALVLFGILGVLLNDVSLFAFAFGLKIYLILLFGIAAAESIFIRQKKFEIIILFFAIITMIGIFINAGVGKYPWEGMAYETAFGVVSTTREWWTQGERRFAGFTRASFDAATILGLIAGLLLPSRSRFFSVFIGGAIFAGVYLTTSKSMTMATAILIMWRLFTPSRYRISVGQLICVFFCALVIALPTISCIFQFNEDLMQKVPRGLGSFAERVVSMWPKSCAILTTPFSWLLGGGIGSIGVPQQYMTPNSYSAADNIFVYIYVSGGIVFSAMFIYTFIKSIKTSSLSQPDKPPTIGIIMVTIICGLTLNMLEQPFFCLIAGLLVAQIWQKNGKVQRISIN